MRYPIEQYDKHGFLKPPVWLWLGWFLLAKAWVVFVIAGVSRESGSRLLEMIYPVRESLYLGLVMGLPAIAMMWLIGLRHPDRMWVNRIMATARGISMGLVVLQLGQTVWQIMKSQHQFSWPLALTAAGLMWYLLFLYKSKRVKTCLSMQALK